MKMLASLATLSMFSAQLIADPVAHLVMHSDPGDWLGQGKDYDLTFTPSTSPYFFTFVSSWSPTRIPDDVRFILANKIGPPNQEFVMLTFATDMLEIPMAVGHYPNARRASSAPPGYAGLDIGLNGSGANQSSGSFTVHDFAYSGEAENWVLERFDASFEHHSDFQEPALRGRITFNSNPVPEPAALIGLVFGLNLMIRKRKIKGIF